MANRAGFNPDDKISKTSKSYEAALAGLMSGVITRSIVQPMDVFKIRYQLQIESKSSAKYQNLKQSFGSILTVTPANFIRSYKVEFLGFDQSA